MKYKTPKRSTKNKQYYCIELNCNNPVFKEGNKCRSCGNKNKVYINRPSNRKGVTLSEVTKQKMRESNKTSNKGKICSLESRKKMSDAKLKGKDYITPLVVRLRNIFEYRQWRSDVFKRDDFICQKCGLRGIRLEVHHIKRFLDILREYNIKTVEEALLCVELWDLNNGITYCEECHKLEHLHKL
jgi:hypothetical protein